MPAKVCKRRGGRWARCVARDDGERVSKVVVAGSETGVAIAVVAVVVDVAAVPVKSIISVKFIRQSAIRFA
jgi:hypothetical protein